MARRRQSEQASERVAVLSRPPRAGPAPPGQVVPLSQPVALSPWPRPPATATLPPHLDEGATAAAARRQGDTRSNSGACWPRFPRRPGTVFRLLAARSLAESAKK